MKKLLTLLITLYQKVFSFDTGFIPRFLMISRKTCMYYPTCSQYTKEAIEIHGPIKGISLGAKRIARCNPWNTPGVDLVPPKKS